MELLEVYEDHEVWRRPGEDRLYVVRVYDERPGPRCYNATNNGIEAVGAALRLSGRVLLFHGKLLVRINGCWRQIYTAPALQTAIPRLLILGGRWGDAGGWGKIGSEGGRVSSFRECETVSRDLASRIFALPEAFHFPTLNGFISHPIIDCPPTWRPRDTYDIPCASKFHHLPKLASAFNLDPASHAMYYMYLLGAFHGVSLTTQRPILLIDSWQGSRGKTQLSQTIPLLCDNSQEALVASGDRRQMEEKIVSHLVKGQRSIVMGNIDRKREFVDPNLVALATDGALVVRAKYDREASTYPGILVVANLIFGAASLHEDFLSRTWRVELRGPSTVLDPPPNEYALEHREEIISEILLAHAEAIRYTEPVCTRFEHFERKAAGAYCRAFSLSPEQTHARIRLAIVGSLSFRTQAIQSLARARESAFSPAAFETLTRDFTRVTGVDLPKTFIGATALGYTFNGKDWIQNG